MLLPVLISWSTFQRVVAQTSTTGIRLVLRRGSSQAGGACVEADIVVHEVFLCVEEFQDNSRCNIEFNMPRC